MPRPLVLGNGRMLVCLDSQGRIRDLTWPFVGQLNHLSGHSIRLGIWTHGRFSWLDGDEWSREQFYEPDTLTGVTLHESHVTRLRVRVADTVLQDSDALVRQITVSTLSEQPIAVRLFSTHDLRLAESDIGDTALFDPGSHSTIHYKRDCAFAFGGSSSLGPFQQYAAGVKGFGGYEGTWRDAEDGELEMTPIAQGSVDSTLRLDMFVEPDKPETGLAELWCVCASTLDEAAEVSKRFLLTSSHAAQSVERSHSRLTSWLDERTPDLSMLPDEARALFRRSLLIIAAHCDSGGGIIAACDSDIMQTARAHYAYAWPRDGALIAMTLDRVGEHDIPRKFFEFCRRLVNQRQPYFLQKYCPDGSLGASWIPWTRHGSQIVPIQEDETALVLCAAAHHFATTQDVSWLRTSWESFLGPLSDFLVSYLDPETKLPLPSYDMWEERYGVHTATVAAVIAGLKTANDICTVLGDQRASTYKAAADETLAAMDELLRAPRGYLRGLAIEADRVQEDPLPDATLLLIPLLGTIAPCHPLCEATTARVAEELSIHPLMGICRYPGDYYFRRSEAFPGNVWVICTLWLARVWAQSATREEELCRSLKLIEWAVERSKPTGALAEQYEPSTGEPLSVAPLAWSHAEYINAILDYAAAWRRLQVPVEADKGK